MMQLYLSEFAVDEVLGIYGENKDRLADRMRYLHPIAATSFRTMNSEKLIRCSDMLRTPEGSLKNRQANNGKGLRPGWSGHNYGFSIDIDVSWNIKNHGFKNKIDLDLWMQSHGWYCHNILGETRSYESWHYNYFGEDAEYYLSFRDDKKSSTWSRCVAQKIDDYYGHWWETADMFLVQRCLKTLNLYKGPVNGEVDAATTSAIKEFQSKWDLEADGKAGPMTKRTLLLVSSEVVLMDEPC